MLKNKTVVVGVCGGIAAYKTCELVSRLKKEGAEVRVIMTQNATQFVAPLTFETLSTYPVVVDTFAPKTEWDVQHVGLAQKADLFVIAPATANFVGKYTNGIADDMLTTTVMATKAPVLLAPAMNTGMLNSDAFVSNIEILKNRGVNVIEGQSGLLACGDVGKGRMAEPIEIYQKVLNILLPKRDYVGKKVVVTAGATIEKLDPARFITNFSSGKMGCEIAKNAHERGAEVVLILGRHTATPPKGVKIISVDTTQQMYDAVMEELPNAFAVVKAGAPCDYAPVDFCNSKIKSQELTITFKKNPDIAKEVGKIKGDTVLVAFSAETDNLIQNARQKLISKNADFVVANDVTKEGAGFNVDTNIVSIVERDSVTEYPKQTKSQVANIILNKILTIKSQDA